MKTIEELFEKLQGWTWKSTWREKEEEEEKSSMLILWFVDYTHCFGMERLLR